MTLLFPFVLPSGCSAAWSSRWTCLRTCWQRPAPLLTHLHTWVRRRPEVWHHRRRRHRQVLQPLVVQTSAHRAPNTVTTLTNRRGSRRQRWRRRRRRYRLKRRWARVTFCRRRLLTTLPLTLDGLKRWRRRCSRWRSRHRCSSRAKFWPSQLSVRVKAVTLPSFSQSPFS